MQETQRLVFSPFHFDVTTQALWREGQPLSLQAKTVAVLAYLLQHPQQLVTKEVLLHAVWPEVHVGEKGLKVRIRELCKALDDDPHTPRFIETVHGSGYRWIAPLATTPPVPSAKLQVPSAPSPQVSSLKSPASTIVGREAELTQLHAWFEQARSGTQQMVFVTGEPGIGKTAVVSAFLASVDTSGDCWIAQGQCVEHYGAGEAYLPVLAALDALSQTAAKDQLLPLLRQHAPLWLAQLPSAISPAEREDLQRQLAGTTAQRMLRELANVLAALTAIKPLVLVLEDLHWSDPSTVTLLAYLARWHEPLRLLVLGTYRPAEVLTPPHPLHAVQQELVGHKLCQELSLQLLSEAAIEAYLQQRLSHTTWPTRLARALYQRTEGNPLFMVAMVEELLAQGRIAAEESTGLPQRALRETTGGIPERLRQLVTVQMERLRTREQRLLEAASVAGLEFSAAEVAAALGGDDVVVETRCESLARRQQFLRPAGVSEWPDGTVAARYGFSHALYQYLWQERVTAGRWRRWQYRIGSRKEAGYGDHAPEIAAELALHFEQGRDYRRAIHYLQQAARNAIQRSANREAIAQLTTAQTLLPKLPDTPERTQQELTLHVTLGTPLMLIKGYAAPEVERTYARARELCQQVGETPQLFPVLRGLWQFHLVRAELPEARALGEQLLRLAQRAQDPALLLEASHAFGTTLYFLGECAPAREYLERGMTFYDPQRHSALTFLYGYDPKVGGLSRVACALWLLGYPDQALQRVLEALTHAQTLSHPQSVAFTLLFASVVLLFRRDWQAAQERAEAMVALSTRQEFAFYSALGTVFRGSALAGQGHGAEGIAQMRQGVTGHQATRAELSRSAWLAMLAEGYRSVRQAEEGLTVLAEALAAVNKIREGWYEAEIYRLYGEVTLQQQSKVQSPKSKVHNLQSEAETYFQKAIEVARRQQAKSWDLRATVSLARLWQQQGKKGEARQMLAEIYGWFTEGFETNDLQEARALLEGLAGN